VNNQKISRFENHTASSRSLFLTLLMISSVCMPMLSSNVAVIDSCCSFACFSMTRREYRRQYDCTRFPEVSCTILTVEGCFWSPFGFPFRFCCLGPGDMLCFDVIMYIVMMQGGTVHFVPGNTVQCSLYLLGRSANNAFELII